MCGPNGICEHTRIAGQQVINRAQEIDWRGHRIAAQLYVEANPLQAFFGLALCCIGCHPNALPAICCTAPVTSAACATACCALGALHMTHQTGDE